MRAIVLLGVVSAAPAVGAQQPQQPQQSKLVPMPQPVHVLPAPQLGKVLTDGQRERVWAQTKEQAVETGLHVIVHLALHKLEH